MKPVNTDVNFPALEKNTLTFWEEKGIEAKGLAANQGKKPFVFYDGPPFATGTPHYGHILAGTLKDIVTRYWAMKGHYVERRWGWDCHGLPVEFEMEKELGLQGRHDIEEYGIAKFNEACRSIVLRYTEEWERTIRRTGRWIDFKNCYRTMDATFMESVWWVFKSLWDKGLIFEGHRVMPYSWRISTPLSNFEANLNYQTVQDPAVTVKAKSLTQDRSFLIWTTTPWTLPSNLAIAVGEDFNYVEVKDKESGEHLVLAEARVSAYFKDEEQYELLSTFKGKDLAGEGYEPIFPYFKDKKDEGAFQVVLGHHVTTEDGSGLVHMAPAYGEDDYLICQKYNIPLVNPVDDEGNFTAEVPDYQGKNIKEADKQIIKDLKAQGKMFRHDTLEHSYPFCWRSDTPLIYRAISTWFVKLDPVKDQLIKSNQENTHWVPEHIREGRFGNWLENARDWNISRNRFWGTPLPIWQGERKDGSIKRICVGSIEELEKLSGEKITDLHKHFMDDIEINDPECEKPLRRTSEVLDCWFESGSMPYGQAHYPFENKERFEAGFPADFIAEGLDQTRGWFYTLSVLGNALFGKAPFKNVIVNGMILAEDGKKMSKRLKNYPEPDAILDSHGADALRAFLAVSPASRAEELRFSEAGVKEIIRSVLLPFWNAYSFFVTYALADGWTSNNFDESKLDLLENDLDKWVVSRVQSLIQEVDEKMAVYHLYEVIPAVLNFIEELTNWYIRLNRRRFWKEGTDKDKDLAYTTLYYVLTQFSRVLAPVLPFITEEVYQNLRRDNDAESVHLSGFPIANEALISKELEAQVSLIEQVVNLGRNCRSTSKLKTRQPLKELKVITTNPILSSTIERFSALIQSELNVKQVSYSTDESQWVNLTAKPDAKKLGRKLGKKMKPVTALIRQLTPEAVSELQSTGSIELEGETILADEILIDRQPKEEGLVQSVGEVTVWIDSKLNDSLISEGRAREFVNRIQKLRKDIGLVVTDRIEIEFDCPDELKKALDEFEDYISAETLAKKLSFNASSGNWMAEQKIDEFPLKIRVEKC